MKPTWVLVFACVAAGATASADDSAPKLETTHLLSIPIDSEGVDGQSLKVAPRSAHVVWRKENEGRSSWVLDGKPGKAYAEVGPLVFTEDGAHWAHFARVGRGWVIVLDGEESKSPEAEPDEGSLRFVPGGTRLAFLATRTDDPAQDGRVVVVDGAVVGPVFAIVSESSLAFSPDGKRVAYRATSKGPDGSHDVIVVDGKPGKPYPVGSLGQPRFSADGTRWAYPTTGAEQRVVVDGVEGPPFRAVVYLSFAPAGSRYAYFGIRGETLVVVVDGEEQPAVAEVADQMPLFSADGLHLAYVARKADGWRLLLDGQDGPPFARLGAESLQLSPDGKRNAYWAGKGPKPFYVIDGAPQKEVDLVGKGRAARFSPDSKRFAYTARRARQWVVVTDGVEGPETEGIAVGYPVFTLDGKHVVYEAETEKGRRMFVDGKPWPAYDGFAEGTLAFGEDGATVAMVARKWALWRIVVDGVEGEEYQALLPGSALVADGPRSFHAWFLRGGEILHERVTLKR